MRISLKPCRAAGCCMLAVFISVPFEIAAFTQTPQPEQRVATQENPRIVVTNAPSISILPWEKNEVSISAEVSGVSILSDEVKVKSEKNKLEITCVPLKQDRIIYLKLRVPRKSVLAMRNGGNSVEVKEPSTETPVNITANLVQLNVPESSSLDMRTAPNASEFRTIGQGGFSYTGIGNRRIEGTGPTDVRVIAEKARVVVARGTMAAP